MRIIGALLEFEKKGFIGHGQPGMPGVGRHLKTNHPGVGSKGDTLENLTAIVQHDDIKAALEDQGKLPAPPMAMRSEIGIPPGGDEEALDRIGRRLVDRVMGPTAGAGASLVH